MKGTASKLQQERQTKARPKQNVLVEPDVVKLKRRRNRSIRRVISSVSGTREQTLHRIVKDSALVRFPEDVRVGR